MKASVGIHHLFKHLIFQDLQVHVFAALRVIVTRLRFTTLSSTFFQPSLIPTLHLGWLEVWTLNTEHQPPSRIVTMIYCQVWPWPATAPWRGGGRKLWHGVMATFTCHDQSRETISVHLYSQTRLSWRSIKSGSCAEGKLSRQLPDDVRLRISLTGSRFLSSRHWRHSSSASEWHNHQNTVTKYQTCGMQIHLWNKGLLKKYRWLCL